MNTYGLPKIRKSEIEYSGNYMTRFWRDGHYREGNWVEGHYVTREDWSRSSGYLYLHRHQRIVDVWDTQFRSFVSPNAICPRCGEAVFYYENNNGSKVWFDELGPPWTKHGCFIDGDDGCVSGCGAIELASGLVQTEEPVSRRFEGEEACKPALIQKILKRGGVHYITLSVYEPSRGGEAIYTVTSKALPKTGEGIIFVELGSKSEALMHVFDLNEMQEHKEVATYSKDRRRFLTLAKWRKTDFRKIEEIDEFRRRVYRLHDYERKALAAWLYDNTTWTYSEISRITYTSYSAVRDIAEENIRITHVPKNPVASGMITEDAFSYLELMIKCLL